MTDFMLNSTNLRGPTTKQSGSFSNGTLWVAGHLTMA